MVTTRSRTGQGRPGGNATPTAQGYARLERRLALLAWLHRQLGYETTSELLEKIRDINEGFGEDGRSHAVYQESGRPRSDILTVVRFLHRVLNAPGWATATIKQLLTGHTRQQV